MRIKPSVIFIAIGLLLFSSVPPVKIHADDSSNSLSIGDAVYADLALKNYLDNVSLYYSDSTNANTKITLNQDRHWLPASTVKTFAAMYAYDQMQKGNIHSWDPILVDAKNVVPTELDTDEYPMLEEQETVTIDRLIKQMITQSDNTAFNVLLDVLGRQNINDYIHTLGLVHSNVGSKLNLDTSQEQYEFDTPGYGINTTTAEDYAKAFTLINEHKVDYADDIFSVLSKQKINNMIPLLLPKDVVIAHKTGDLDPLYHDGGIIDAPSGSYVLTIFSNAGDPSLVAHLSQLIYTKNYQLVGQSVDSKSLTDTVVSGQSLDPLVTDPPRQEILGASNPSNFQIPSITAADLGITAKDLSLVLTKKNLPHVFIPADSPWHFLVPVTEQITKVIVIGSTARSQVDLSTITQQIAEVKDLQAKGKTTNAESILHTIQPELNKIVADKNVATNPQLQTEVQSISETRFSVFSDQLKNAKNSDRLAIIKEIATQAKSTATNVQPFIPKSINATNPTQKPLIAEVLSTTPSTITIRTAGGQQLTIPTDDSSLKVRSKEGLSSPEIQSTTAASLTPTPTITATLSSIKPGTTIAIVGSSQNDKFTPSFILTNLPKQLSAPEPVTVLKVNVKNDTMVVSENGVPVQVDISKQTVIKGDDTNVALKSIKQGDVVVVHGQQIIPAVVSPTGTITPTPQPIIGSTPSPVISPLPTQTGQTALTPTTSKTAPLITGQPTSTIRTGVINTTPTSMLVPTPTTVTKQPTGSTTHTTATTTVPASLAPAVHPVAPVQTTPVTPVVTQPAQQPIVIQSTSIQVIGKKQDAVIPQAEQTHTDPKQQPASQPPAAQPPAPVTQPKSAPAAPATAVTDPDKKK